MILSYGYLRDHETRPLEYYMLLLLANFGGATLVAATHFASFFLGLEILSVSLYALIGYPRLRGDAIEAAVKYLVLAAVSAAFLLFGMALHLRPDGHDGLLALHAHATARNRRDVCYFAGLALIVVGIGFKLALVPFHMWTPDVYQGAPAPVTAFIATVSKGAVFALLLRFFRGPPDYALAARRQHRLRRCSPSPPCSPATCWRCCRTTSSASWPTPRSRTWATCWWPSWPAAARRRPR